MVCRIQRALNFVPAAQSLQTVKGMGIGMNTVKPFYESRKKVYDCHVWWHPNFPFHLHKHMEFVHVTEGEMDATVAGVNYHLITGDCLMIYPNQLHSYSSEQGRGNNSNTANETGAGRKRTRRINLNAAFAEEEPQTEEDRIAADMMSANGNTVDFTA